MKPLDIILSILAGLLLVFLPVLVSFVKKKIDYDKKDEKDKKASPGVDIKQINTNIAAFSVTVAVLGSVFIGLLVLRFKKKSKKECWDPFSKQVKKMQQDGTAPKYDDKGKLDSSLSAKCMEAFKCTGKDEGTVKELKDFLEKSPSYNSATLCKNTMRTDIQEK